MSKSLNKKQIYIVGAAKSGTTSLAHNLGNNPLIIYNSQYKEPSYHARASLVELDQDCDMMKKNKFILDWDQYSDIYARQDGEFILDASTCYLWYYQDVIASIKEHSQSEDDVYIIIVLREPISRMHSQYLQMVSNGVEPMDFNNALVAESGRVEAKKHPFYSYAGYSMYYEPVKAYKDAFDRVLILDFDRLAKDAIAVYDEIFHFLGLSGRHVVDDGFRGNKTGDRQRLRILDTLLKSKRAKVLRRSFGKLFSPQLRARIFQKLNNYNIKKSPIDFSTIDPGSKKES